MADRMVITDTLGGRPYIRYAPGDDVLWPGPNGPAPGEFLSAAGAGMAWVRHDNGDTLVPISDIRSAASDGRTFGDLFRDFAYQLERGEYDSLGHRQR